MFDPAPLIRIKLRQPATVSRARECNVFAPVTGRSSTLISGNWLRNPDFARDDIKQSIAPLLRMIEAAAPIPPGYILDGWRGTRCDNSGGIARHSDIY